jgi:hypothetical protein
VRSLPTHGRKKKVFSAGRHSAPSQVEKVVKRAGLAVPAVAVVGALAAASHGHHPAAAPVTRHQAVAGLISEDRMAAVQTASVASDLVRFRTVVRPHHVVRFAHHATASPSPAGRHHAPAAAPPSATPPPATPPPAACKPTGDTSGMLPENYATIVDFLTAHEYTSLAAAGIAGNIYQESGGNPESGGGLIGWTPLPSGYVTGNSSADLDTQLAGLLTFNDQFPSSITVLNAATSPVAAADIYMNDFEHPGLPEAANREEAATAVAAACGI